MRKTEINNTQSTIDTGDIIARIEQLENDREEAEGSGDDTLFGADEALELATLKAVADDCEGCSGWDSTFRLRMPASYALQLADDLRREAERVERLTTATAATAATAAAAAATAATSTDGDTAPKCESVDWSLLTSALRMIGA